MISNFSQIKRRRVGARIVAPMRWGDALKTNITQFEDLDAWKIARLLAAQVYGLCRREPLTRDFGLCDQLRRAAVSVMNNISESWESPHQAEKIEFYGYARRSCGEVRSMSYVLLDNDFVTQSEQLELRNQCIRSGMLVSGMIRSAQHRD